MEALFIFIVKSGSLIALFYFAYFFLLRKETFFNSSRWFLLAGLVTSIILPLVVYTKVVWIDPIPAPVDYTPVANYHYVPNYSQHIAVPDESFEINWYLVSLAVYAIGFAAFMIKFGIDFYSLNSVLKGKKVEQQEDFKFVDVNENIAPFSYFDYIVYNSSMYSEKELESILEHEKVHSDQYHTIDVIVSRIFCILFWFNPLIWLYKKAILQNLEFIADSEAAKKISDKKVYQYTLLKITTHETCVSITNHFYQSLIKKRIVMLNKNQSKKWNYWKYYAVLPALALFVLSFQIKTISQEKKIHKGKTAFISKTQDTEVLKITKSTTDQELKELTAKLKAEHNIDLEISNIKRNKNNELTSITIKVIKENGKVQIIDMNSTEALKDCSVVINTDDNGSKSVTLVVADQVEHPIVIKRDVAVKNFNGSDDDNDNDDLVPTPPSPPVAPPFPAGPLPPAPAMAKMPKAPKAPKDINDKVAWGKFEKDMAEFEKKMKAIEPEFEAYGKQVDAIMSQREAIFEKEMEKYQVAMQKFNIDMEKFGQNIELKFGKDSKEYENSMKEYENDMKQHEIDMRQHEIDMKQHAKDMKQHAKDIKRMEKESRKS